MRYAVVLLVVLLGAPLVVEASETVFCGKSLGHEHIKGVQVPCPENSVCLNAWFRWNLQVQRVVAGPSLPARVVAATQQHSDYSKKYEKNLRVFALKPIEDEEQRKLLGAEYYFLKNSPSIAQNSSSCAEFSTQ